MRQVQVLMTYVWKCAFFVWLATITVLSLIPHPPVPVLGFLAWDKFQHAFAYGVLAFLGGMSFTFGRRGSGERLLAASVVAVFIGGVMELAQGGLTVRRSADFSDLLADAVGAAVVTGLVYLVVALRAGRRWPFRFVVTVLTLTGR